MQVGGMIWIFRLAERRFQCLIFGFVLAACNGIL